MRDKRKQNFKTLTFIEHLLLAKYFEKLISFNPYNTSKQPNFTGEDRALEKLSNRSKVTLLDCSEAGAVCHKKNYFPTHPTNQARLRA